MDVPFGYAAIARMLSRLFSPLKPVLILARDHVVVAILVHTLTACFSSLCCTHGVPAWRAMPSTTMGWKPPRSNAEQQSAAN
jgi:hypothetical protein